MPNWRDKNHTDADGAFFVSTGSRSTVTPEELAQRREYEGPCGKWLCHGCAFGMDDPPTRCPRCLSYAMDCAEKHAVEALMPLGQPGAELTETEPF